MNVERGRFSNSLVYAETGSGTWNNTELLIEYFSHENNNFLFIIHSIEAVNFSSVYFNGHCMIFITLCGIEVV